MRRADAEANMSPFFAALLAAGYMGLVFVLFGLAPKLRRRMR
jgi:hypothetical protein